MEGVIEFKEKCQKSLDTFFSYKKAKGKISSFGLLDKIQWDFKDSQTQYLTHRYHSYPARFIPQIPRTFIKLFTKEGSTVLDPFCGCGTTLVESSILNRNSIGNDFNPLATLISKVKITPLSDLQILKTKKMLDYIRNRIKQNNLRESDLPQLPNRNISKLFSKEMLKELQIIKNSLNELKNKDSDLHDYLLVSLSSTIRAIIESENGDDIYGIFERKIKNMNILMREYKRYLKNKTNIRIVNGDARNLDVGSNSVDLIVTSPPYVNALDYYRVHMYNMLWLGMDYNAFKLNEIGGHSHYLSNRFRLMSEYLGDMLRSMIEMNRVLKNRKICVIVVGNSSIDYELIESYKHFISMTKFIGFEHKKTIFRNINKSSKYFVNGKIDDEYIIILQKISDTNKTWDNEEFIANIVRNEMVNFRKQAEHNLGSSTRGKKVSKERLDYNLVKIGEAIKNVNEDIKIKVK